MRRYKIGRQLIRGLKTRGGGSSAALAGKGLFLYSGGIRVGGVRGESHSVTSGDTAEGRLQE